MIKNRHFSTPLGVYHLAFVDKNDIRCFYKVNMCIKAQNRVIKPVAMQHNVILTS